MDKSVCQTPMFAPYFAFQTADYTQPEGLQ